MARSESSFEFAIILSSKDKLKLRAKKVLQHAWSTRLKH